MVLEQRKILPNCVLPVLYPGLSSFLPPHLPPQWRYSLKPQGFSLHCVNAFALVVICSVSLLLSQQSSERRRRRRNWVNSPELVAVTDSLLLSDSAHSPMFVWFFYFFFPLSIALSVASPMLSPSVLISHHLYPHNRFCSKSAQCPTLLCSFPVFPFKHRWMMPGICCAFLLNGDYLVTIGFYSQKSTLAWFKLFYCYLC